jgi:hypothetical protein
VFGALIYLFIDKETFSSSFLYSGLQATALLLGLFHVWWMYEKLFWSRRDSLSINNDSFLPEFVYTLFITLTLTAGILAGLMYFGKKDLAGLFWSSTALFLLPFLFLKTFDFLNQIPRRDFRIKWIFTTERINEDRWDWVNETWVYFEVREKWEPRSQMGNRLASFRILAPRQAPLGEVFRLGVREYNKKGPEILVQDLGFERENQGKFWWLFSIKFIWTRPHTWIRNIRFLDPHHPVVANDLRTGDVVYVRRMPLANAAAGQWDDDDIAMGQVD